MIDFATDLSSLDSGKTSRYCEKSKNIFPVLPIITRCRITNHRYLGYLRIFQLNGSS